MRKENEGKKECNFMTFDFEKFEVYQKAKFFTKEMSDIAEALSNKFARIADQLIRASLSIPLNIAEGAGRYSKPDKRNFYVIARGSVFECVAIIDMLLEKKQITADQKEKYYATAEELSKMISGLINSQR